MDKLFKNSSKENDKKSSTENQKSNNFNSFRKKATIKKYVTSNNFTNTEKEKENEEIKTQIENNNNLEVKEEENFPKTNFVFLVASPGGIYNDSICKLIISDSNLVLIQGIKQVTKKFILDISIKDNDSFATISKEENIEIWSKQNNIFKLIEIIYTKNYFYCFKNKIKYLKNGNIIICCYDSIKIYNNIKSLGKHQLSVIIKAKSPIFNIRKDFLVYFTNNKDDKNIYSTIYFYKLKNFKLTKNIKCNIDIPEKFDFLDDNRIIVLNKHITIISLLDKKITQLKIDDNNFSGGNVLVNENKKIFFAGNKDIYVFNIDNYQIMNIIKLSLSIKAFIPLSQEEIGILAYNDPWSKFYDQ